MNTQFARMAAPIAAALALALSLGGCTAGSSPSTGGTGGTQGTTSEKPNEAAKPGALTASDFAERVTAAQLKAGMAHIDQKLVADGRTIEIQGHMTFTSDVSAARAHVTMNNPTPSEVILLDGKLYINSGVLTQNKFMLFSDGDDALTASVISAFTPQTQMDTFGRSIEELRVGGTQTIDGVETTEYTLKLDSATLLSGDLTAGVDPHDVDEIITYVVWVGNDDDLMRRSEMRFSPSLVSTFVYTKWGEDFDIQAPSPDQIVAL